MLLYIVIKGDCFNLTTFYNNLAFVLNWKTKIYVLSCYLELIGFVQPWDEIVSQRFPIFLKKDLNIHFLCLQLFSENSLNLLNHQFSYRFNRKVIANFDVERIANRTDLALQLHVTFVKKLLSLYTLLIRNLVRI